MTNDIIPSALRKMIAGIDPTTPLVMLMRGHRHEFQVADLVVDADGFRVPGLFDVRNDEILDDCDMSPDDSVVEFRLQSSPEETAVAHDLGITIDYVVAAVIRADRRTSFQPGFMPLDFMFSQSPSNSIVVIDGRPRFHVRKPKDAQPTEVDGTVATWSLRSDAEPYVVNAKDVVLFEFDGGYGSDLLLTDGTFIHVESAYGMAKKFAALKKSTSASA